MRNKSPEICYSYFALVNGRGKYLARVVYITMEMIASISALSTNVVSLMYFSRSICSVGQTQHVNGIYVCRKKAASEQRVDLI